MRYPLILISILLIIVSCRTYPPDLDPLHIVFVTGDEEYRSEESMPMMGKILKRELGAKVSVCYSLDSLGYIDPNNQQSITGLEALKTADLMVVFMRFRQLPSDQRSMILDYAESGRPIVGFRTSTHSFWYTDEEGDLDTTMNNYNIQWPTKVFGQQWITHHGHFDDGAYPLTSVHIENINHPILNGVSQFDAYSWLYHVDGGAWNIYGNPNILLNGTSLKSNHDMSDRLDQFPITNPVAWTKSYKESRVFFTTLGHPYDFKNENMRRLVLNGIYWALRMEGDIPDHGIDPTIVGSYEPNNSGFGQRFKAGMRPVFDL